MHNLPNVTVMNRIHVSLKFAVSGCMESGGKIGDRDEFKKSNHRSFLFLSFFFVIVFKSEWYEH